MKKLNRIFAVSFLVALLAVASLAQQQGSQTLSTITLSSAISPPGVSPIAPAVTSVTVSSLSNVTATASIGTTIWCDTEAMDVVTNTVPSVGTTVLVTRGTHGTKAEGHASGRTCYVGRPNLFQGFDPAGSCTAAQGQAYILPWINLTNGARYDCKTGGEWMKVGVGSQASAAITTATAFCTSTAGSAETEYLNGAACSGATTATFRWVSSVNGEAHALRAYSSAAVTGGTGKDVLTLYKNGTATTLTCTIAASGTSCSDTSHSVAVIPGDVLTFQYVTATSDTAANMSAAVSVYGQ